MDAHDAVGHGNYRALRPDFGGCFKPFNSAFDQFTDLGWI
jgi:hypothetical protein